MKFQLLKKKMNELFFHNQNNMYTWRSMTYSSDSTGYWMGQVPVIMQNVDLWAVRTGYLNLLMHYAAQESPKRLVKDKTADFKNE